MSIRYARLAALLIPALVLASLCPVSARGAAGSGRGEVITDMKVAQRRANAERARAKIREARERARHEGKNASKGMRSRLPREEAPLTDEPVTSARLFRLGAQPLVATSFLDSLVSNYRANNRATDAQPGSGQAEECIAAWKQYVLVAWNDGENFNVAAPNNDILGYGFSSDSGKTFVDGGVPPKNFNWTWTSDPVVTVNERLGKFYFCALVDSTGLYNGIGVVPAHITAGNLVWETPVMVRKVNSGSLALDKEWLVADSTSDSLHISYTTYTAGANYIQYQRSADGTSWWQGGIKTLSAPADSGWVQGSRPAVGPNGEVYVIWHAIGAVDVDYFHIRKSTDYGASFGTDIPLPQGGVPAAGFYGNYGSGAPGYNRQHGVDFPSISVDRSNGAYRGRVYVAWNECINFYDDGGGGIGAKSEPAGESGLNYFANAMPFAIGNTLRGVLGSAGDRDYFGFGATQGQTGVFFVDSADVSVDLFLRIYCTDSLTQLAVSYLGTGPGNVIVFTFPTTGLYYVRCAALTGGGLGGYRIRTTYSITGAERARDHRDIFVTSSANGVSPWSVPNRVNADPGYFDNWLPEVSVSGQGQPIVVWYDWHYSPAANCGGVSDVSMARSDVGGANWTQVGRVTDAQTFWSNIATNIAPNQGDYITLHANENGAYVAWADGRNGDPDVYTAYVPYLVHTAVEASLVSAEALPDQVTLTWYAPGAEGLPVNVYRRTESGDWTAIDQLIAPANARVVYTDRAVAPGDRLGYRIGVLEGGAESFHGEAWVEVPRYGLTLSPVAPNPVARDLWVSFSLPRAAPATLRLIDVAGREVRSRELGSLVGPQRVNLGEGAVLPMGVYVVRLTQGGTSVSTRVSVVR
jgi:hypothetical protein